MHALDRSQLRGEGVLVEPAVRVFPVGSQGPAEMALDFARKIGYRVEAEHLDCPRGLVDVHPRVLERRDVAPRPAEAREGLDPSRQRLVDLVLDPGQRAHVEFRDE